MKTLGKGPIEPSQPHWRKPSFTDHVLREEVKEEEVESALSGITLIKL
jgi:hypothetical protein